MGDDRQSEGRNDNAAVPANDWPSKGVDGDRTRKEAAANAQNPTEQPYSQGEQAERSGRTEEATGEARSFRSREAGEQPTPDPNDLQGPAGDPAEGKPPGGSTWPA
ncbi:MAG: hypothetical protein JWO33_1588 [Caulobacteraceae bacterium]|nr:hypothetical protein [Caulobacteraceae bacterium]